MYHHSKKRSYWFLFSGFLLVSTSSAQAASVGASSAVLYDEGWSGLTQMNGPVGGSSSAVTYTSTIGLSAGGYGSASFGALHANASSVAAGDHTQTRGQGSVYWNDQVTISSTTQTGSAFAHASFFLTGGLASYSDPLSLGAVGNSTVAATVRINGGTVFSTTGQLVSRNGAITTDDKRLGLAVNGVYSTNPSSSLTGVFSFDIPFTFGTSFQMYADLTAFTQALASAPGDLASAYSNFGSSGYWGGISDIHLADGTVLSGYSLTSDSGFNWTNAYPTTVPVPAALWLFGSGLLGLIGVSRRKKKA